MSLVKRFEDIEAWQEARKLTQQIYAHTQGDAFRKDYGLVDQIRRAGVSSMNNVVEGFDSGSFAEFAQFLGYARRSASEVQSCLYVAWDQRYLSEDGFNETYKQAEKTRALITGFIRYLRRSTAAKRLTARPDAGTPARRHAGT